MLIISVHVTDAPHLLRTLRNARSVYPAIGAGSTEKFFIVI